MFSGIKTKFKTLGFDSSIDHDDPSSEATATQVSTVLSWAQDAGMDTGNYDKTDNVEIGTVFAKSFWSSTEAKKGEEAVMISHSWSFI